MEGKKDSGRGESGIKFTTSENTEKFYFTNKGDVKLDYPEVFIGTMRPTSFNWTKMRHLYDIMQMAWDDKDNKIPIIKCGTDTYTASEFLSAISSSRMWTFDFPMI